MAIFIFLEIGRDCGGRDSEPEPYSPSDAANAYQQQQLLEELDDDSESTQLPPISILDSSCEDNNVPDLLPAVPAVQPTELPSPPSAWVTAANVATAATAPVSVQQNTTDSVLTPLSVPTPSAVAAPNTTNSVAKTKPVIPASSASAMEGVATALYSGSPPTGYFAVKNHVKNSNSYFRLNDGGKILGTDCYNTGSFFVPGDTRENLCVVEVDMTKKLISSTSFERDTLSCSCCGKFMAKVGDNS